MKVSILINDLRAGGAERVVSILLKEFKYFSTIEIYLVLLQDRVEYEIDPETRLTVLSDKALPDGVTTYTKLNPLAKKYANFCRDEGIDVSLSFMYKSNFINARAKTFNKKHRVILSERSYPSSSYPGNSIKNIMARKLISYFYNKCDLVLTNSKLSAIDLKENFNVKTPIKTIYNPIILKKNQIGSIEKRPFTFINVGNLYPYKNQDLIIDAFSKLQNQNTRLLIMGKGQMKTQLRNQIDKLKLNDRVSLLGYQSDPYEYLCNSDCFILASGHEGFPNVLLEAMNARLCIISSDCKSGPREILAPDTNLKTSITTNFEIGKYGILVPKNNIDLLKKAMEQILNDKPLREKQIASGKKWLMNFESSKIALQLLEVISHV